MTTPAGGSGQSRLIVFISYSHEPKENADFVRNLAGRLKSAGIDYWLDEENIAIGDHFDKQIKDAIEQSDVGLFVINERWLTRPRTEFELEVFGDDARRRVGILRDNVEYKHLGPHMRSLNVLYWRSGETDEDAAFWQIYCGIRRIPPGPSSEWARKGREAASQGHEMGASFTIPKNPRRDKGPGNNLPTGGTQPGPPEPLASPKPGRIALPVSGRPVAYFTGEDTTYIVTDRNEWTGVGPDLAVLPPVARLSEYACAFCNSDGELVVGTHESMAVRLRKGRWEYLLQEAPILSFCTAGDQTLAGTIAGRVVWAEREKPAAILRMSDPVMGMASAGDYVLVFGARSIFGRLRWEGGTPSPKSDVSMEWIDPGALGRPVGFFPALRGGEIGVFSVSRVGLCNPETRKVAASTVTFEESIREVVFLGARRHPYAVLDDSGGLTLLDDSLESPVPVRLPQGKHERIIGCCAAGSGNDLALWTAEHHLYLCRSGGANFEEIGGGDAVFAYAPPVTRSTTGGSGSVLHVVRWSEKAGASVEEVTTDARVR